MTTLTNFIRNIRIDRFIKRHPKEIQRCIERNQYLITTYTGCGYYHHILPDDFETELDIVKRAGYNVYIYSRLIFITPKFHVKHERRF